MAKQNPRSPRMLKRPNTTKTGAKQDRSAVGSESHEMLFVSQQQGVDSSAPHFASMKSEDANEVKEVTVENTRRTRTLTNRSRLLNNNLSLLSRVGEDKSPSQDAIRGLYFERQMAREDDCFTRSPNVLLGDRALRGLDAHEERFVDINKTPDVSSKVKHAHLPQWRYGSQRMIDFRNTVYNRNVYDASQKLTKARTDNTALKMNNFIGRAQQPGLDFYLAQAGSGRHVDQLTQQQTHLKTKLLGHVKR